METGFVQAGSVRLEYFTEGQGPELLVLIHGATASARIWRLTQEALDSGRFRTLALSNRGAGGSDHTPNEADYSTAGYAADLWSAVQALGLRDFTLVGHSYGGGVVTRYALDHQETIKGLVLLDSSLVQRTGPPAPTGGDPLARLEMSEAPADFQQVLLADMATNEAVRANGQRDAATRNRFWEQIDKLKLPVLVAGGDQDDTVGPENMLNTYLALPTQTRSLQIFHGVGHSPNVRVPGEVAAALSRFVLQTIPAQRAVGVS